MKAETLAGFGDGEQRRVAIDAFEFDRAHIGLVAIGARLLSTATVGEGLIGQPIVGRVPENRMLASGLR